MRQLFICIGLILLCNLLGSLPALFTIPELSTWYPKIIKPSWQPPGWLFGPVWTTLFTLMGISIYLVNKDGFALKENLIFAIQFLLNMLWTLLFFKWHQIGLSIIEIVLLLVMITYTIFIFYKKKKSAAYLLIPYALWVSFATVLTATIYNLN
jgi:translocator protein